MANLASYQKLTRVLPSMPFGSGADGAYSSATIPTLTKDSCSGTAASTTLTTAGSTFANGDILLIHQTRGTGVGQWEIDKVSSGGGTATLTLQVALNYTYTDSGASQAQAIKILQYTNVTVSAGTWTVPSWDGNVGGVLPLAIKGALTVTGTVSGVGKGYQYGSWPGKTQIKGGQGEGTAGAGDSNLNTANGNGGGGGSPNHPNSYRGGGGGGGGYGTAGTTGGAYPGHTPGAGGDQVGVADLTTFVFGGGGGAGGGTDGNDVSGHGGRGGGSLILFVKNIANVNAISFGGDNGQDYQVADGGCGEGGGGGAGGSCLIVCQTATLGTNAITAPVSTGGSGYGDGGGAGGVGRIAVHHSGAVTGTTSPTFTDVSDPSLIESTAGFLFNLV